MGLRVAADKTNMTRSPRVLIVVLVVVLMLCSAWLWLSAGALGHQLTDVPAIAASH